MPYHRVEENDSPKEQRSAPYQGKETVLHFIRDDEERAAYVKSCNPPTGEDLEKLRNLLNLD